MRYADQPTVDTAAFDQLAGVMEDEFADLLQTYLTNVPNELARIDEALRDGKADNVVNSAHTIKGSSANMTALRLGLLCRDLEHLARRGTLTPEASVLRDEIRAEFERVKPIFERRLAAL